VANAVTCWLLHLVPDPSQVLAEVARVVRPGGRYVNVSSRSVYEEDDLRSIIEPMVDALRAHHDDPDDLVAAGRQVGLVPVQVAWTSEQVLATSPNEQAAVIEARTWSSLWDLPDEVWEHTVLPAITALRALPEPDRPRRRRARMAITVLDAPAG
jgi:SAM-dependent methyltransferase